MLVSNIRNGKDEPTRSPKLILIYSEGERREKGYIDFFKVRSSQIKLEVEVVPKAGVDGSDGNNSPTGLLSLAKKQLEDEEKYDIVEGDEVWFLIDTDKWEEKIQILRTEAEKFSWKVAQSNPCFELWLYYHHFEEKPSFPDCDKSTVWKSKLNDLIKGGFDSRKHPELISSAIKNSESNYSKLNNEPSICCTDVFNLGKSLYELVKNKL